jgi:aryl-alcohol dehydrogenase-like predicted oxidoreductase
VIVAIAYLLQKTPYVFPIIGGRKVEHLLANLEALEIDLTAEQVKELESVVEFDPGFPTTMIVRIISGPQSMSWTHILT